MTDNRTAPDTLEHDEYHSSLEMDDTTGWRVYLVPALGLLFAIGMILSIVLSQG